MKISELDNRVEWRKFVDSCPDATFYHTPEWMDLLQYGFPIQTRCFAVEEDDEVVGIFPAAISKRFFYKRLDSLPYSDYGGPLTCGSSRELILRFLSGHLAERCRKEGITFARVNLCDKDYCNLFVRDENMIDDSVGDVILDLNVKTPEHIWNSEFSARSGQRKYINRFERDGFNMIEVKNSYHLQQFYRLYAENLEHIKATPFPYTFFENAWKKSDNSGFKVLLAENGGFRGGVGFFVYKEKSSIYLNYAAIDRRSAGAKFHMMVYLFWEAVKWASERNIRYVHFGTTPNNPNSTYYRQKTGFGGTFIPQYRLTIPYNYALFKLGEKTTSIWNRIRDKMSPKIRSMIERR